METDSFVRKGAATFHLDYNGPPKDTHFVLLPKLTLLAFSSAIEPLRVANQITGKELYRWFTMTADGAPVRCSNSVQITPDSALEDIVKTDRSFICSGIEPATTRRPAVTAWARKQTVHGATVGGICTGAFTLAQAGLLSNRRFTLHWENQPAFMELHPEYTPTPNLYENDRGLRTCGGGSAATDMMLDVIETDHSRALAIMVADMCLHSRSAPSGARQQSSQAIALGTRNPRLINALDLMDNNLEDLLSIDDIAAQIGLSRRQLERLFKRYLNDTPHEIYVAKRIARAYALISETNLSITEISVATGFTSPNRFSIRFRKRYGISPHNMRKGWATPT